MISRDPRYDHVQSMYETKHIQSLNDIFYKKVVPKTIVANDMGMKMTRFNKLMNKVELFTLEQILHIASFCKMDPNTFVGLWMAEYHKQKASIPKRK